MSGILKFIKSAVVPKDYPNSGKKEVAIAGRSNAGKSSFLNALSNSKIAKVSSTPGKTRLLNFFNFSDSYVLVDMPGYGFAARSGKEQKEWHTMVENYLSLREELAGLILVVDIRREWTEEEELLKAYTDSRGLPIAIVLTKGDKLTRNHLNQAVAKFKKDAATQAVFATSTLQRLGHDDVEQYVFDNWIKNK